MVSSWQENIPSDVLVEIFQECISSDLDWPNPRRGRRGRQATIHVLASVCRRWRHVTLSNPLLWSNICIFDATPSDLHTAEVCLEKSKDVPLSILIPISSIRALGRNLEEKMEGRASVLGQAIDLLSAHQNRWCTFILMCACRMVDGMLVLKDLPLLRNLTINVPLNISPMGTFIVDISNAALLQTLSLWGENIILRAPCQKPLLHLTAVELDHIDPLSPNFPSVDDCVFLLNAAPNLKYAHLYICSPTSSYSLNLPNVRCEHLEELKVGSRNNFGLICSILSQITTPVLHSLRLAYAPFEWYWGDSDRINEVLTSIMMDSTIGRFLERSHSSLAYFSVESPTWDEQHLISLLRIMPDLMGLEIMHCQTLSSRILNSLVLGPNSAIHNLCPQLEHIIFEECSFSGGGLGIVDDVPDTGVIDATISMISSRWEKAKLRLVEFDACRMGSLWENKRIQRCVHEGLLLYVVDDSESSGDEEEGPHEGEEEIEFEVEAYQE